jgi:alpha-glucosidase
LLTSPDRQCTISVSLEDGNLSYQVSRDRKTVINKSSLGLRRDDQDFEHSLVFDHTGKIEKRCEKYELFAGPQPNVDHNLNHRSLVFRNAHDVPIEIELAASDEGVAFRYRFMTNSRAVRIVESE